MLLLVTLLGFAVVIYILLQIQKEISCSNECAKAQVLIQLECSGLDQSRQAEILARCGLEPVTIEPESTDKELATQ